MLFSFNNWMNCNFSVSSNFFILYTFVATLRCDHTCVQQQIPDHAFC